MNTLKPAVLHDPINSPSTNSSTSNAESVVDLSSQEETEALELMKKNLP